MDWSLPFRPTCKPRSRLLALPPELRDLIFAFALTSSKPLVAFRLDSYQRQTYQESIQPPLTQVNKQIRRETLPLFYDCNSIILHTEESKINDASHWLFHLGPNLSLLTRISLWIRYVTLTNDNTPANGAMQISMHRIKSEEEGVWEVSDEWEWVTVTKMPSIVDRDAKFLIGELREMLERERSYVESAEGFVGLLRDLRMGYVKEKMS